MVSPGDGGGGRVKRFLGRQGGMVVSPNHGCGSCLRRGQQHRLTEGLIPICETTEHGEREPHYLCLHARARGLSRVWRELSETRT